MQNFRTHRKQMVENYEGVEEEEGYDETTMMMMMTLN
jgi:hypothetical protein